MEYLNHVKAEDGRYYVIGVSANSDDYFDSVIHPVIAFEIYPDEQGLVKTSPVLFNSDINSDVDALYTADSILYDSALNMVNGLPYDTFFDSVPKQLDDKKFSLYIAVESIRKSLESKHGMSSLDLTNVIKNAVKNALPKTSPVIVKIPEKKKPIAIKKAKKVVSVSVMEHKSKLPKKLEGASWLPESFKCEDMDAPDGLDQREFLSIRSVWTRMIDGCYNPDNKTSMYNGFKMCDEFLDLSGFVNWWIECYPGHISRREFTPVSTIKVSSDKELNRETFIFMPKLLSKILLVNLKNNFLKFCDRSGYTENNDEVINMYLSVQERLIDSALEKHPQFKNLINENIDSFKLREYESLLNINLSEEVSHEQVA